MKTTHYYERRAQNPNRLYAPGDLALPDSSRRMRYDGAGNLKADTYTGVGTVGSDNRSYDAENSGLLTTLWGVSLRQLNTSKAWTAS